MTGGAWMGEQAKIVTHDQHAAGDETRGSTGARWLFAALVVLGLIVVAVLAFNAATDDPDADDGSVTEPSGATDVGSSASSGQIPSTVATEGARLTLLPGPPAGTMAMLETATVAADAAYAVTFRPYGYGPGQGSGGLVIRIETATPQNESAKAFDMGGRNVLVTVSSATGEITSGGAYEGVLAFRPQGGLLAPVLRDVRPVD